IFGKAWGAVKGVVKGVTGAPKMTAPKLDEDRFELGRGRTRDTAGALSRDYAAQAAALRGASRAALERSAPDFSSSRDAIAGLAAQRGPSAAEAQLRAGQDAALRQSIALARSGRGMGGEAAALRSAGWNNVAIQGQTNQQAAMLRAQESDAAINRELAALQGLRSQDLGAAMQQRQLNDARSAQLIGAGLQAQGMRDQVLGTELAAQQQYELGRTGLLGQAAQTNAQLAQQNRQ